MKSWITDDVQKILDRKKEIGLRIEELKGKKSSLSYVKDCEKIAEIDHSISIRTVEQFVLHDNLRRTIFNSVVPVVLDMFKKYSGKPMGDKTYKKFKDEVRELCGVNIIVGSDKIQIMPAREDGCNDFRFSYEDFVIYAPYINGEKKCFLIGNKFNQEITAEDFRLNSCGEYCVNTLDRASEIVSMFQEVRDAEEKLNTAISEFNNAIPKGIDHIQTSYIRRYLN